MCKIATQDTKETEATTDAAAEANEERHDWPFYPRNPDTPMAGDGDD